MSNIRPRQAVSNAKGAKQKSPVGLPAADADSTVLRQLSITIKKKKHNKRKLSIRKKVQGGKK